MDFIKSFLAGLLAFVVGCFVVFFLGISLLVGIAAAMGDQTVVVEPGSILRIDFSEVVTDAPSSDPLAGIDLLSLQQQRQLPLFRALRAIEAAKEDPRIEGIYLRMNGGGGIVGSAVVEEMREALADFRTSGKFIVAYNESYSQGQYYLASVADSIYLQPEGAIEWSGLSFSTMFYKGLLDKLDLKAEVFRPTVCKYKSAVEPYILTKMSEANRRQMQAMVDAMWDTLAGAVAESRGIDRAELERLTDELAVTLPEDALKHRFVDGLRYEDQMEELLAGLTADRGDYSFVSLGDYASQVQGPTNFTAPQVAIVYADGQIVDGQGSGDRIYGTTLARKIAEMRDDETVAAVVLRVNSPGGSALASDVVWREMELLRAEKPVVVSMGSYAASGGYYISCPADVIVADNLTLTGSIGVFRMYLDTIEALENKLGITVDGVKSNAMAGMGELASLTPAERASLMRGVDKVYDTFTQHVAAGRNLPLERVLEIAEGRVWSGRDALRIGLVDGIGGLKTAIALAVDKASLGDDYRVVERIQEPTGWAAVFSSLNARVARLAVRSRLGDMVEEYDRILSDVGEQGIRMYSPYRVELR